MSLLLHHAVVERKQTLIDPSIPLKTRIGVGMMNHDTVVNACGTCERLRITTRSPMIGNGAGAVRSVVDVAGMKVLENTVRARCIVGYDVVEALRGIAIALKVWSLLRRIRGHIEAVAERTNLRLFAGGLLL